MIRQLNRDDPLDIADYAGIFEGQAKFQYTQTSPEFLERVKQYNLSLLMYRHNYVFGKYDGDLLIGAIHFEDWNDGVNYHMGLMINRVGYDHPKTYHPLISDTRIDIMNYGVGFFEAMGLTTCYTLTPDIPDVVRVTDVPNSIFFGRYDQEIVERVPADTRFPWVFKDGDPLKGPVDWRSHLLAASLPLPQLIRKLTRKS